MGAGTEQVVERFRPTSGRVIASIGLVLVAALQIAGLSDPEAFPLPVRAGALLVGVLIWASMLRPALFLTSSALVMRNMVDTVEIPLAGIEDVVVRQVVAVRAGERRYVSPVVGRSFRQLMRRSGQGGATAADPTAATGAGTAEAPVPAYADFVEERIRRAAADAAMAAGVRRHSDEQAAIGAQARRTHDRVPVALLAVTIVAFVVSLVI